MISKNTNETQPVIMVADDEQAIRKSLADILNLEGYNVIEAVNGDDVLNKIGPDTVDVILLDINMPGVNGIEITRILKSNEDLKHIPIVIVTGEDDQKLRIQALKAGADDFLLKPPHFAELSARVKSLLKVKAYNDHMRNYQKILENQVAERTKQLKEAFSEIKATALETIFHLSRAAEYKDEETAIHIRRMSNYAAEIARALGLEQNTVEMILYTSSMHDIGKIGIPDHILMKKGKLTEDEWKQMRRHPLIGAEILQGAKNKFIQMGRAIALTHHEKWDGSGYPSGTKGEQIPIEGRICAVADVFDALTTRRPYKEAFSVDKAVEIIGEGRGSHFDPQITDVFINKIDNIVGIMKKYNEEKIAG